MRIREPIVKASSEKTDGEGKVEDSQKAKNVFDGNPYTYYQSKRGDSDGYVTLNVSAKGRKLGGLLLYAMDHGMYTPGAVRVSVRHDTGSGSSDDVETGDGRHDEDGFRFVHTVVLDARTTGLKWVRLTDPLVPSEGIELINDKLSEALLKKAQRPDGANPEAGKRLATLRHGADTRSKAEKEGDSTSGEKIELSTSHVEFTAEEWRSIGESKLRDDHYIRVGDKGTRSFFKPAARKRWVTLLSAHQAGEVKEVKLQLLRASMSFDRDEAEGELEDDEIATDAQMCEAEDEGNAHLVTTRTKDQQLAPLRVSLLREGELTAKDFAKVPNASMLFTFQCGPGDLRPSLLTSPPRPSFFLTGRCGDGSPDESGRAEAAALRWCKQERRRRHEGSHKQQLSCK